MICSGSEIIANIIQFENDSSQDQTTVTKNKSQIN